VSLRLGCHIDTRTDAAATPAVTDRNRQGIVRADADLNGLRRDVIQRAEDAGWQVNDWQRCALVGGDGNQEYFLIATRRP